MLGNKLTILRNSKQLTQQQLANIFNTSKSSINAYENEYRTLPEEILNKYCEYFKVSHEYLQDKKKDLNFSNTVNKIIAEVTNDDELAEYILISIKAYKDYKKMRGE